MPRRSCQRAKRPDCAQAAERAVHTLRSKRRPRVDRSFSGGDNLGQSVAVMAITPSPTQGSPPVSLNRHSSRARTAIVSFRSILGFGAKHVIAPLLIPDHVVGVIGRGILRRLIRPNAGRHCRHRPIDIAVAEEG